MIAAVAAGGPSRTGPPGQPSSGLPTYRTELDGLRAVAVLLVIVNHLSPSLLPGGFLGVDVFFVLSGFVITRTLAARTAAAAGALAPGAFLLDFYRRRVQRLVPALLVCVLITALLSCLVIPDPAPALHTALAALFGVSNLQLQAASTDYFGSEAALNPFTQTWSLGVEEQFYLVYPLLALVLGVGRSRGRLPRRFLLTLLAIAVLSLGAFLVAGRTDPSAAYLLTHLRLWELAGGCLLVPLEPRAARWAAERPGRRRLVRAGGIALLALLGLSAVPERGLVGSTPAAVLATMVLITALQPGLPIQRGLAHPWLRHIGQISYPLYLWHWSVISLARRSVGTEGWMVPVLLLLMLGAAEASHRWLETPLRRGGLARGPRRHAAARACGQRPGGGGAGAARTGRSGAPPLRRVSDGQPHGGAPPPAAGGHQGQQRHLPAGAQRHGRPPGLRGSERGLLQPPPSAATVRRGCSCWGTAMPPPCCRSRTDSMPRASRSASSARPDVPFPPRPGAMPWPVARTCRSGWPGWCWSGAALAITC